MKLEKLAAFVDSRLQNDIKPREVKIPKMKSAADEIWAAKRNNRKVIVPGDYDVDGIMATAIVYKLCKTIGCDVSWVIPDRFRHGYGLNPLIVEESVPAGSLVILVDNGICAFQAIADAKAKGCTVVVLDHHLRADSGLLPDADIIIDPHAIEGQVTTPDGEPEDFNDFCGAGLAYMLTKEFNLPELQKEASTLAAYATITDCVSLVGPNWLIAQNLQYADRNLGLSTLAEQMNDKAHDETSAGYTIGPALNAVSRVLGDASAAVKLMTTDSKEEALELAKYLQFINEDRKGLSYWAMLKIQKQLDAKGITPESKPRSLVVTEDIPQGIIGIAAGRLDEIFNCPTVVFSPTADGKALKGSGRSEGKSGLNHLKNILDMIAADDPNIFMGYGGHAAAAGLSIKATAIDRFTELFDKYCIPEPEETDDNENVFSITVEEIPEAVEILGRAAPYGQHNPVINISVDNIELTKNKIKCRGTNGNEYLTLFCEDNVSVCYFDNDTTAYVPEDINKTAKSVSVIGTPAADLFKGKGYKLTAIKLEIN